MHADTGADVLRLQTALRDLVALSAIPAAWIGGEPPAVAAGLADALVALLDLDFAFVRLCYPDGGAVEVTRGSAWKRFPEWLEGPSATDVQFAGKVIVADAGDSAEPCRGVALPIGVNGDAGLVAAASDRSEFPDAIEQVLLSLAANHAATAFQNACLIAERRRAEDELRAARDGLEVKVAERTAELRLANHELGALRRVATLVAAGAPEAKLYDCVAREVARVIGVRMVTVDRFDADACSTVVASLDDPGFPVGSRWPLDGPSLGATVLETARPARVDDYAQLQSTSAAAMRTWAVRSAVGVPILVDGRVWGVICTGTTDTAPLPAGTEAFLADFSELLATGIARAESRHALARLADEQAALRRVATLVARGVRPDQIFSAVSEEVDRLFGSGAAVLRFEHDGPASVFVGISKRVDIPIGTRWEFQDGMASAEAYRTGRSARVDAKDWSSAPGPVAAAARRLGVVSTVVSPIVVEGRLWGAITVASTDEPLPLDSEDHLEKFTELIATAISNAEAKSELAASRRRIVGASDEARRRIERDLHDGTQQRLVSLAFAVRTAEAQVEADRSDLRSELSGVAAGLADAVAELQELSRGIHPAVLSQGGLDPALRALARRSPIPVELEVARGARVPESIEVAAYYIASEALANAAKHAQASRVEVSVAVRNGTLLLSIRDDGVGGADPARGSGLVGLTDRVEALGGSIRVHSRRGAGTTITAELPLEPDMPADREESSA